jgi:hypothetical protein
MSRKFAIAAAKYLARCGIRAREIQAFGAVASAVMVSMLTRREHVAIVAPHSPDCDAVRASVRALAGNAKTGSLRLPKFRVTSPWKQRACKWG